MKSKNQLPLVINDAILRKKTAAESLKLLKKFDRLQQSHENLFSIDQNLFQNWYELSFRDLLSEITKLKGEYDVLAKFHNSLIVLCQQQKISPSEALSVLMEESKKYEFGSAEEKEEVRNARAERLKQDEAFCASSESSDDYDHEEECNSEENEIWSQLRDLNQTAAEEFCEHSIKAADIIFNAIGTADSADQIRIILRVWDLLSASVKKRVQRAHLNLVGKKLEVTFARMREFLSQYEEQYPPVASLPPEDSEKLKRLYRKFVRLLHPDSSERLATEFLWEKQLWSDGQTAYRAKDFTKLSGLYKVLNLRLGRLNELTISEILETREVINQDLSQLKEETRQYKKALFWNFSKRKNFAPIEKKIRADFLRDINRLCNEISDLSTYHEDLKMDLQLKPWGAKK